MRTALPLTLLVFLPFASDGLTMTGPDRESSVTTLRGNPGPEEVELRKKRDPLICGSAPLLTSYRVPAGNAEAMAKRLTAAFKNSDSLSFTAIGSTLVTVWGSPEDQRAVAKWIANFQRSTLETLSLARPGRAVR
jgi:hypothetical protein